MVVYLPLGLLIVGVALLPFRMLPRSLAWLMVPLAAYAVLAIRLIIERRRSRLGIPLPRKIVVSVAVLAGMLAGGVGLFVLGMGRLTTSRGLAMVYVGGCLIILSVTAPTFRLVDIVLRKASRLVRRSFRKSRRAAGSGSGARLTRTVEQGPAAGRRTTLPPAAGLASVPPSRPAEAGPRSQVHREGRAPRPSSGVRRGRRSPVARVIAQIRRRSRASGTARRSTLPNGTMGRLAVPPAPPPPES